MSWTPDPSGDAGRLPGFGWAPNPSSPAGTPAQGWYAVVHELATALSVSAEQASLVVKATAFALHVSIPEAVAVVGASAYGTSVDLASATSREIQFSAAPASSSSTAASTAVVKAVAAALSVSTATAASVVRSVVALAYSTSSGPAVSAFPATAPSLQQFGAGPYSYVIPWWCYYVDVIGLGAGGGGGGGDGGLNSTGEGGKKGTWLTQRLVRGLDIPWSLVSLTGVVGTGGSGGPKEGNGQTGGATTIVVNGSTLTCPGGIGGLGAYAGNGRNTPGEAAGSITFGGQPYNGGAQAATNADGNAPGGGGGPGSGGFLGSAKPGRVGGNGAVWFRASQ